MMTGWRRDSTPSLLLNMFFGFVILISSATSRPINDELGTFSFDIHHRFSDTIAKRFLFDELPVKGSLRYYADMVDRDLALRGRRLADDVAPLTFKDGNQTRLISGLGFLHYASVSVGSPAVAFLVALDTGSNLFWLPCDCQKCTKILVNSSGKRIELNIYSPRNSTSSRVIPCDSDQCYQPLSCDSASSVCPYSVDYLSDDTSSKGYLVEENLELITDNALQKRVSAKITLGCGLVQTGVFLEGGAPNGLFGLGLSKSSVPSILASQGLMADSFSLCFGSGTIGRITFGDKGSANQSEAPINFNQKHASYNITMKKISVNRKATDVIFHAIFDTGTSFAYLGDPAFSIISNQYDEAVNYTRFKEEIAGLPFKHCYDIRQNKNASFPSLELTMKNGAVFKVLKPVEIVPISSVFSVYCLGIIKSDSIDIIGQNFMTGYRVVFDRERMVVGWENSDCYSFVRTSSLPTSTAAVPTVPAANGLPSSNSSTGDPQVVVLPFPLNHSPVLLPATFLLAKALLFHIFLLW